MSVKVRFAPSPTGRLHVGNVRTALVNWLFAKGKGGQFVLRIDDTDLERSTKEFEQGIETDLTWLGMAWDERHNQSARFPVYQEAVERLKAQGRLYPAYETQEELDRRRKVQLSRGQPPIYDRAALKLSQSEREALEAEGRRPHWRFRLDGKRVKWTDLVRGEVEVDTASMSDPVLIREDGAFLYTLPSVVDDVDMGITHVIRGEDHVTNTGAQIEVFQALGARPPEFAHLSLLVDAEGDALSKRLGSLSISELREQGMEPLAVVSHLAKIGTSDPVAAAPSLQALAESFDFAKFGRAPARYDPADLERLNAGVLHAMPYPQAQLRLQTLGCDLGEAFWTVVRANIGRFEEARDWAAVVTGPIAPVVEDADFLAKAAERLPDEIDEGAWARWTKAVETDLGVKGKALFMPLRKALTGRERGPDMAALTPLIGRDRIQRRLRGETA
jgi:glutamyl-tRNA synthetase